MKLWVDVASYWALGAVVAAPSVAATNAVHTLTTPGAPTGGTFKLDFLGQRTSALTFDESAADVDTALEALSTVGTGGVVSAGGALPTAITVTWSGTPFAGTDVPLLAVAEEALTGGTNPHLLIRATTAGGNPYAYLEAGTQEIVGIDADFTPFLYVATVAGAGVYRATAYR